MKTYDTAIPHRHSAHARRITIGILKQQRLDTKNTRRAKHGLPPIKTYAEI